MYCVKFLNPLRGKFGFFAETTDYADVTDEGKPRKGKDAKQDPKTEDNKGKKDLVLSKPKTFVIFVAFCWKQWFRRIVCGAPAIVPNHFF